MEIIRFECVFVSGSVHIFESTRKMRCEVRATADLLSDDLFQFFEVCLFIWHSAELQFESICDAPIKINIVEPDQGLMTASLPSLLSKYFDLPIDDDIGVFSRIFSLRAS